MARPTKGQAATAVVSSVQELEKNVESWVTSKKASRILRATGKSTRDAADHIDSKSRVEPKMRHRSVTL